MLRHTLNPTDTPVRPGSYEEKLVCQVCDLLGRKAEANCISDRTGQPRPMLPEFIDRCVFAGSGYRVPGVRGQGSGAGYRMQGEG